MVLNPQEKHNQKIHNKVEELFKERKELQTKIDNIDFCIEENMRKLF